MDAIIQTYEFLKTIAFWSLFVVFLRLAIFGGKITYKFNDSKKEINKVFQYYKVKKQKK